MKKFFEVVVTIKERVALSYAAAMCIYLFFLFVFRQEGAALPQLFSVLLASVAAGTMQVVAFSDLLFKKLAYGWRMMTFFIAFGAVLIGIATGFGWFPVENAGAWATFLVIFVLIFAAITAGIEIYYRASGRRWDDKLDWYRKRKDGQ
ncbi:MAG: DUF3021 family protein [Oscillospiraceae bacterium]|nr:DUF3021 family protein [Oscillospiraceae bacterium]